MGSDGTVSIDKKFFLSPRVENLKVKKVIKVSYLNYRESSVFRVFRDSYAYERFTDSNILRIRISEYFTYLYLGPNLNMLHLYQLFFFFL